MNYEEIIISKFEELDQQLSDKIKYEYPDVYHELTDDTIRQMIIDEGYPIDTSVNLLHIVVEMKLSGTSDEWTERFIDRYGEDTSYSLMQHTENEDSYFQLIFDHMEDVRIGIFLFETADELLNAYPTVPYMAAMIEGYFNDSAKQDAHDIFPFIDHHFKDKLQEAMDEEEFYNDQPDFIITAIRPKHSYETLAELYISSVDPNQGLRHFLDGFTLEDMLDDGMIEYDISLK